jgi:2-C-methyl-D-erythritol 4-phosphate cytidylyltransferase
MPQSPSSCIPNRPDPSSVVPRLFALIPCGGSGSRAGGSLPKQYQQVAGQPMVQHTLAAFACSPAIAKTLVVVAPQDRFFATAMPENASFLIANYAGDTRAKTVLNGLNHLKTLGAAADDWVLVHDAARCLVTPSQIQVLIDACQHDTVGGLLALPLPDTLKEEVDGRVSATIPRVAKWLAQTPQMFRLQPLIDALQHAGDQVTDESSAMEAMGLQPKLVRGSAQNFKVTYPDDFPLAEAVLNNRQHLSTGKR